MTKRPLQMKEKYLTLMMCAATRRDLTRCDVAVFAAIVQRQNPQTGQCDPSVYRLMSDTGYGERAIRKSTGRLERAGVLRRGRGGRRGANNYVLVRVDEGMIVKWFGRKNLHRRSEAPARGCHETLHSSAPKKKKEKKKKRAQTSLLEPAAFEKRIVMSLERIGSGYEGLLSLPHQVYEDVEARYRSGQLSFEDALRELIEHLTQKESGP